MYCSNCGEAIKPQTEICPHCGVRIKQNMNEADKANIAVNILSLCCIPLLGIILYFVWKDNQPNAAKSALIFGIIGCFSSVIVYGLFFLLGIFAELMNM